MRIVSARGIRVGATWPLRMDTWRGFGAARWSKPAWTVPCSAGRFFPRGTLSGRFTLTDMRWIVLALMLTLGAAPAQLAITEVLPVSLTHPDTKFHGAEFWELTNFGTNDVDLHGYGFRDSDPEEFLRTFPFTNLVIHAGESIIFFRIENDDQDVLTSEHFKAWWGAEKLPSNLVCKVYGKPGLAAWEADAVWLFDASGTNVVDSVEFGPIQFGRSFTYDTETGGFGIPSTLGVNGAFVADKTGDVGSPGVTAGPVPVQVLQNPVDQSIDGGMTATFTVVAGGVPRPRYQWHAGTEAIPGANGASLVASNAGGYHVVLSNGLSTATSLMAALHVNTNPTAASITVGPANATVFIGQTAAFKVAARGYPPPTYQWRTNGVDIPGATANTLEITDVTEEMSGLEFSVVVWNSVGSTTASAVLTVTPRPRLVFTEVMVTPANADENRHFAWVELTNQDTNTVNLLGWRFAEEYSFLRAHTITSNLTLRPSESVVLAERLDERRFAAWWGRAGLPEMFKLYTYTGLGLDTSFGALLLWNAAARDPFTEVVSTLSWAAP